MFGIAKGFGLEEILESTLRREFSDQQEVLSYLLQFTQSTLREVKGGLIAGVGLFFLLFTSIKLFSAVENSFNRMWGIRKGRSILRKTIDYSALLVACPILLAISSSAAIFITSELSSWISSLPLFSHAKSFAIWMLTATPFLTSFALFALLLYAIPCAPIRLKSSLLSAVLASLIFQGIQCFYIELQLKLTKISAVYGSFAALPLFLMWLWISWFLLLLAEESVIFFQEKGWREPLLSFQKTPTLEKEIELSLLVVTLYNYKNDTFTSFTDFQKALPIPIRSIIRALENLKEKGLLCDASKGNRHIVVMPTKKAHTFNPLEFFSPQPTQILQNLEFSKKLFEDLVKYRESLPKSLSHSSLSDYTA
jgi:membrane protein